MSEERVPETVASFASPPDPHDRHQSLRATNRLSPIPNGDSQLSSIPNKMIADPTGLSIQWPILNDGEDLGKLFCSSVVLGHFFRSGKSTRYTFREC